LKLKEDYFLEEDVIKLSRDLIGKVICQRQGDTLIGGIICETEAYKGVTDRASHAYQGRKSARTESMYLSGGHLYVYLCYGIRKMLNVVTNKAGIPEAILIRGIVPLAGKLQMMKNRGKNEFNEADYIGPGKVSQAMKISMNHDRLSLQGNRIWIEDRKIEVMSHRIVVGPRVGVEYAGKDALLPYRFQYFDFANPSI